ncbi:MAG: hypothetical protein II741_08205 [Lachnospiraceae bacterium]|jgi:hypothetical protein|nr:hypothetical protein [Lachnospiraceae bacterium]
MKEQLYTIPLNDAVNAGDECPFCFIERNVEQDLLDYVLGSGSSYMEADMRAITDSEGFCRDHFKKMFTYGNTLGNGWILKTHYMNIRREMDKEFKSFRPGKVSLMDKLKKATSSNSLVNWARETEKSCYICGQFEKTYQRYLDTFFYLWNNDPEFVEKVSRSKGFCIPHFGDLCEKADETLSDSKKDEFYLVMKRLMTENFDRLQEDVSWLVEKFDYQNQDADWKNSKDAVQRGMQKLKGGYPADAPYRANK